MPIRAVPDTNVLVSGLMAAGGPPRQIIDAWLEGQYVLVTSLYLMEELIHVVSYPRIRERLRFEEGEMEAIVSALLSRAEVTPGRLTLPGVTRDPKDDAIVACAVEGKVDYVVSGDQDVLALGQYQGIEVVTPRQFIEILASCSGDA
jgi:putative PIN family toxin of toxin-antitoxin system